MHENRKLPTTSKKFAPCENRKPRKTENRGTLPLPLWLDFWGVSIR